MTGRRWIRSTFTIAVLAALWAGLLPDGARGTAPATQRVSVADDESQATGGDSKFPSESADGRYVAFESAATNLVGSSDTNGLVDVFVRDRQKGTTERVSVDSGEAQATGGASTDPFISSDGRYVVFESAATNLVSPATAGTHVFLRDRTNGTTELISVDSNEVAGDAASTDAVVSATGRFVAFTSAATNLVTGDTNVLDDVFVRDRTGGTTERVSVDSGEAQATGGASGGPAISYDGNIVAFASSATNLVSGDTNLVGDVFVRDRNAGTTARVNLAADGTQADGATAAFPPVVSADGRYVAFESAATNLVSGDTNGKVDVFRKDRTTGAILRASVKSDGTQGNDDSAAAGQGGPSISPDGRFVGFPSLAGNLVSSGADTLGFVDVFVHDAITRETVRVNEGSEANGASADPALSGASEAAFDSGATNLGSSDTNGVFDVFARHFRRATGYFVLDNAGGIFSFGSAAFKGSVPGLRAAGTPVGSADIVDLEVTPSGKGYYVLDSAGGIFSFGDAQFFGSVPGLRASGVTIGNARILDMAVTPTGNGYLILDAAGGIFTFGDAGFFGSVPQLRNAGVTIGPAQGVDLSITPTGKGYLILDSAGGIFTFGDAQFFGSVPGLRASGVSIGSAASIRLGITPSGNGYLILDGVGGIFTFGDAQFFGSLPGLRQAGTCTCPADGVDMAVTPTGNGYLILDNVGGIFTLGDGDFFGSVPGLRAAGVTIGPNSSIRVDLVSTMVGG